MCFLFLLPSLRIHVTVELTRRERTCKKLKKYIVMFVLFKINPLVIDKYTFSGFPA